MKICTLIGLFFFLNLSTGSAQHLYQIPDTAFLHFFKDSMPECIKNDSLIIDSAVVYKKNIHDSWSPTGYPYYAIRNLDGIQYFTHTHSILFQYINIHTLPHLVSDSLYSLSISLSTLDSIGTLDSVPNLRELVFNYDSLCFLPPLDKLKGLLNLEVSGNALDSLPTLDSAIGLTFLTIDNNRKPLHKLPKLGYKKLFEDLDCWSCGLDSLPNLDSCPNLRSLIVFLNNLRSLPSVSNCPRLQYLDCDDNKLSQLPDLSQNPALKYLYAYSNLLDTVPDLSHNTKLVLLYLDSNRLSSLPDLRGLQQLKLLHASANRFSKLPLFSTETVLDLDLSHNQLRDFPVPYQSEPVSWLLKDNLIRDLPDYAYEDSLAVVDISENKLDFSDAHTLKLLDERTTQGSAPSPVEGWGLCCTPYGYYTSVDFVYFPQKPFGDVDTINIDTYGDALLKIGNQKYADSYQWYHGDSIIAGSNDTVLHIFCATQSDAGDYTCHSIGQYFNTNNFRFNYHVTEFVSEPQTVIVNPHISNTSLALLYPSVSSGSVTFKYSLPSEQSVSLKFFDIKGSLVYEYSTVSKAHGEYKEALNLSSLSAGTYIARIAYSSGYQISQKLIIIF